MTVRLALFDCDGTLADSQHGIVAAMRGAFTANALPPPSDQAIRQSVGLSVERALATLAVGADAALLDALADAFRTAYFDLHDGAAQGEPLYPDITATLQSLADSGWTLGIATGKSRRGLDRLLALHGLQHLFATLQTADLHPSKPDPAMVRAALRETGCAPGRCVVIGDTSYDMAMARAGGAVALGVGWGYHAPAELVGAGAVAVASQVTDIQQIIEGLIA
jgi:phosphoglycolate phosphatase